MSLAQRLYPAQNFDIRGTNRKTSIINKRLRHAQQLHARSCCCFASDRARGSKHVTKAIIADWIRYLGAWS